jgi:hypothetical protein
MLSLPPPLIHDAISSLAADYADYAIDASFHFHIIIFRHDIAIFFHYMITLLFIISLLLRHVIATPLYFHFRHAISAARCHLITPRHYAIIAISPLIIDIFIIDYYIRCHYAIL